MSMLSHSRDVAWVREAGGSVVVALLPVARPQVLSGPAVQLWEQFVRPTSVDRAVESVLMQYDDVPADAREQLGAAIESMRVAGHLVAVPDA